jgi:hypothetical protein
MAQHKECSSAGIITSFSAQRHTAQATRNLGPRGALSARTHTCDTERVHSRELSHRPWRTAQQTAQQEGRAGTAGHTVCTIMVGPWIERAAIPDLSNGRRQTAAYGAVNSLAENVMSLRHTQIRLSQRGHLCQKLHHSHLSEPEEMCFKRLPTHVRLLGSGVPHREMSFWRLMRSSSFLRIARARSMRLGTLPSSRNAWQSSAVPLTSETTRSAKRAYSCVGDWA